MSLEIFFNLEKLSTCETLVDDYSINVYSTEMHLASPTMLSNPTTGIPNASS